MPVSAGNRAFMTNIIRNEASLQKIREYIVNNPVKWELDKYYPANSPGLP